MSAWPHNSNQPASGKPGAVHTRMHDRASVRITPVRTADDLASTIKLFREYAASLETGLTYQNFEAELAALPGPYAPPSGALLLARDAAGCPLGLSLIHI